MSKDDKEDAFLVAVLLSPETRGKVLVADLSALPVMNRGLKLQMRKLDFAAIWPAPLMRADMWGTTELRIEGVWSHKAPGLVICGVVRRKNTAAKFGDPADMAQRLQDQHERLAAPRRAPEDADVGCALQNAVCGPGCAEIVAVGDRDIG